MMFLMPYFAENKIGKDKVKTLKNSQKMPCDQFEINLQNIKKNDLLAFDKFIFS